ncbi:hypothetical protein L596_010112 [Steinernema carpocapsae]|uniref:G-protein coupled receptors family 1 profile domain-containing protein n=1 Tax=Steinernema carpocapsae TaxID=34508 RepID=A0A4U5PI46_STECR|nr:hypothetical protein L596_010112 [Steinernema carpocapsae]
MLVLEYPEYLPTFLNVDHYFAATLGVVLNAIIIVGLSLKRSEKLGTYRWFLMAHTVNDLVSAVSMGMLELCFDFSYNTLVMIVNGPLTIFGRAVGKTCFMVFATGFVLNIELLALTIVYRYLQICRKDYLYKFSQPQYQTLTALIIIVPLAGVNTAEIFAYTFSYDFAIEAGQNVFEIRVLYVDNVASADFIISCVMFISLATISYVLIIICCKAIFEYLKRSESSVTEKTKKTQRLLTIVLILQCVTPVLTSTLPAIGMIVGILMQWEVRWVTWTLSATFVWLPTLNACISLGFIAPLRSLFQWKKVTPALSLTLQARNKEGRYTLKIAVVEDSQQSSTCGDQ